MSRLNPLRECSWLDVHELVAEDDSHLVVVHVVEEPREDVDGVVAHGEGVPLLVLDHVDSRVLGMEVRRQECVDDAPDAVDLGAPLDEVADRWSLCSRRLSVNWPASRGPAASAWSVAARTSSSNIAEPLGFASASLGEERPVGLARALRLELVADGTEEVLAPRPRP